MFDHVLIPLEPIHVLDVDGTRFYDTPAGRFPSVTTVIGSYRGDDHLKKWRERVGEETARSIGGQARVRGRAVHELAERYLLNDPDWARDAMPSNLDSFMSIKPLLDRHVKTVFGVEAPLYSPYLRTAGRTDLLSTWDEIPSVIDFKTSLRAKDDEKVWHYLVQKAAYGQMAHELTGARWRQIVTVMMVDHGPPQIWVRDREDFMGDVVKVFVDAPRDEKLTSSKKGS